MFNASKQMTSNYSKVVQEICKYMVIGGNLSRHSFCWCHRIKTLRVRCWCHVICGIVDQLVAFEAWVSALDMVVGSSGSLASYECWWLLFVIFGPRPRYGSMLYWLKDSIGNPTLPVFVKYSIRCTKLFRFNFTGMSLWTNFFALPLNAFEET